MKKSQKKMLIEVVLLLLIVIFTIYYNDNNINNISTNTKNRKVEEVINTSDNGILTVSFLDVGQADSILIAKDNEYMLIDAGNNEDGPKLVTYFKKLGITKFKIVIATHAHEDHIGGMDDIIENFTIDNFYMPDTITTTKTFEDVLDALEAKQIAFQTPKINEKLSFQDATLKIISIDSAANNLNDTSIVSRLKYGTTSFLFMGDASSKVESRLLSQEIRSDVLKVGHHGSRYSTTLTFLEKVSPSYAVISTGKNNSYDHPHTEILNRLNKNNIKIYRTDEQGTIIAKSNGTIINFSTIKTDTNG